MGLQHNWNHMKTIFRHPCNNGSIALYAEAALAAGSTAALDILSFGCREPLKHAAGRGQVADWFGRDNVRGFPTPHRRPKTKPGKIIMPAVRTGAAAFWALDALFERGLFYYMLFNIGQEFAVNWTSLVYAELGCGGPHAGQCVFQITDQVIGGNPTDMLISPLPNCHGIISNTRSFSIPSGLQATITYHFNSQPWPPQPNPGATCTAVLFCEDDGKAYGGSLYDPSQNTGNGNTGHADRVSGGLTGFKTYSIRAQSGGGLVWCTKGQIHVTLEGSQVDMVPLTDCFKNKTKPGFNDPLTGQRGPGG